MDCQTNCKLLPRVAMVVTNPFIQDARISREANSLIRRGYKVKLFAWDRGEERDLPSHETIDGLEVERLRIPAQYGRGVRSIDKFFRFGMAVCRRLMLENFDIIHCHDLDTLPFGYLAAKLRRRRLIYDAHEAYPLYDRFPPIFQRFLAWLDRWLARRCAHVITVNEFMVKRFQKMQIRRVRLVPNFPEIAFASGQKWPVKERQELVIGFIGSMGKTSGIEVMIGAVERLAQNNRAMRTRVLLVGLVHPLFRRQLQKRMASARCSIELVAEVPYQAVPEYYRQVNISMILWQPDQHCKIATAMKLYEVMAMGIPVIVSPTGENQEIVRMNNCGLVTEDFSEESAFVALQRLAEDPQLRRELGANGRRAFERNYARFSDKLKTGGRFAAACIEKRVPTDR